MSKNIRKMAIITLLSLCQFTFEGNSENILEGTTFNGIKHLKDENLNALTVNGFLSFHSITISKNLSINGSAKGKKLKCKNFEINGSLNGEDISAEKLEINGSLKGSNINITGETKISGNINASESKFNDIEILTKNSVLSNSSAKNILVKKEKNGEKQILKLKDGSIISGDIVFESESGEIHIDDTVKINGKIKGAKVTKLSENIKEGN